VAGFFWIMTHMRLRIATWNVNSVRLRVEHLARFVAEDAPDVVCLQETKCREEEFPFAALADMGLSHVKVAGQKGWHGVALASRLPIGEAPRLDLCRHGHARVVSGVVAGVEIHNLYVPAGGDEPDREINPKFDHKLDFLGRLSDAMTLRRPDEPILIAGDLNVAPGEFDVWSHRQMSRVVSHTPIECEAMETLRRSLGFIDLLRAARPAPEKVFSWWSYRAQDFRASGRGLRLDHLWASPALASRLTKVAEPARVHMDMRGWERPSDHAAVSADLEA
jgi:exodeoxyribonuclease III